MLILMLMLLLRNAMQPAGLVLTGTHWHCLVRSQDSLATLSCYPDGLAHIVLIALIITPIKARVSVLNDLLHAHAPAHAYAYA